jgi:hypothetical protein
MLFTRQWRQVAVGGLWLLDGALQLRPFPLMTGFAHDALQPAAVGQPEPVPLLVHAPRAAALAKGIIASAPTNFTSLSPPPACAARRRRRARHSPAVRPWSPRTRFASGMCCDCDQDRQFSLLTSSCDQRM